MAVFTTANSPLIAVVGESASGKSSLAFALAKRFNGEIICADSRTIYKGLDIGTAKPTPEEQKEIPHHLLDVVRPDEPFSAAHFKELATKAIDDIGTRGKLPILVGGTGLYVDAVLFDYSFAGQADAEKRQSLGALSTEQLRELAVEKNITLPANEKNRRHLVRALETEGSSPSDKRLRQHTLVLGVALPRAKLRRRIEKRVEQMFRHGLRKEVQELQARYDWDGEALTGIGYREFKPYYEGEVSMSEVKRQIVQHTLQLAKRQRTWFKRNRYIEWITSETEAMQKVSSFMTSNVYSTSSFIARFMVHLRKMLMQRGR